MIEQEAARFLRGANVADVVVSSDLRVRPDFVLASRLLRLERVESPSAVVVGLEVSLTRSADLALLLQQTYLLEDRSAFADVSAAVAGYNRLLTEILERLLRDLAGAGETR